MSHLSFSWKKIPIERRRFLQTISSWGVICLIKWYWASYQETSELFLGVCLISYVEVMQRSCLILFWKYKWCFFFLFRRNSVKETYRKKELGRQGFERNIEHIYFNYFICIQDWGKESKHGFKNSKLEDQCTHR